MLLKDIIKNKQVNKSTAVKFGDKVISYEQLYTLSEDLSLNIKKIKDDIGNNIGIFLPNSDQYVISYFGIAFLEKTIVPISIKSKADEVRSTCIYCELSLILTNTDYLKLLKDDFGSFGYKVIIYNVDTNSLDVINKQKIEIPKTESVGGDNEDSVAIMLHTSGTTSNPKRVMLTHRNLISNIRSNILSLQLTKRDITLIALPMFFGYCNTAQFLTHLYLGSSIVILDSIFSPKKFFEVVVDEKITNFTGVPTMLSMLLSYRYRYKYDLKSLKYVCFGGGNMPVELLKQLFKEFPSVGFVQTYGQTEASPRITALLPQKAVLKIGSVGKPIPGVTIRIVDENGNDTVGNNPGEIIVNSPGIMKGYYKRPEETAKVIKNGWLFTGDIGYYDADKYIYLIGRKKNIIISGGINIYPEEIEEVLLSHPAIKEVRVYGQEDEFLNEIPVAKVVLNEQYKPISKDEILIYCQDKLSSYKIPKMIDFCKELPKTYTGKIKRI